jgi:NADH:ubiquinone oxidoreductase subunit 2 (subunit N)
MYNYILDISFFCVSVYESLIVKKDLLGDIDNFIFLYNQMEFVTSFEKEEIYNNFGKYMAIGNASCFNNLVNILNLGNNLTISFFEPKTLCLDYIDDVNKLIKMDNQLQFFSIKNSVIDLANLMSIDLSPKLKMITECQYLNYISNYIRAFVGFHFIDNSLFFEPQIFIKKAFSYNFQSSMHTYRLFNLLLNGLFINQSLFLNDIFVFLPFIYFFIFLFFIFTYVLFLSKYKKNIEVIYITSIFSIIYLLLVLYLFLNLIFIFNLSNIFLFNFLFNIDLLNLNSIVFIIFILIFFISLFLDYFRNEKLNSFEYLIILLIAIFGLFCLICSFDFLSLYISLELQTLCLYILASYKYFSNFSTEAGLKYFVLGALSSGFLLFGISILYGLVGSTNFYDIYLFLKGIDTTNYLSFEFFFILNKNINFFDFEILNSLYNYKVSIFFCFLFIMFSFFFKLGLAPFHIWLPDVYQGSPSISTAFFALLPKIGFFVIFLKFLWFCISIFYLNNYYIDMNSFNILKEYFYFKDIILKADTIDTSKIYSFMEFFQAKYAFMRHLVSVDFSHIFSLLSNYNLFILNFNYVFLFCSIISLIIGTFSALNQNKIKRFIAFSAIVHVGFIFVNFISFNLLSLNVILLYLFLYTIINLNFFSIFLSIRDTFTNKKLYDILDFSNIYKTNKLLIYLFILNLFSMAGVPPLSGFFMKMYVFYNLINSTFLFIFFLIIISCFGAFYYIRIINISLFKINKNNKSLKRLSKFSSYIIILSSYFNLFFFLFPNFFFEYFFEIVNNFEKFSLIYNPIVFFI